MRFRWCHRQWMTWKRWLITRSLHRCWWRMLETKCVGGNYKVLAMVLAILATNIHSLLVNVKRWAPTLKDVTNPEIQSSTSQNRYWPYATNINPTDSAIIHGDGTDDSADTCDDKISCDYVVGTFIFKCNVKYQNKAIVRIMWTTAMISMMLIASTVMADLNVIVKQNSLVLEDHAHSKCIHDEIDERYTRNVQGFQFNSYDGYDCYNIDEYAIY